MIETSVLAVARATGTELELHLSNQDNVNVRVIDYNADMIITENTHTNCYDFIYISEVVRYSTTNKDFYGMVMEYRKGLFEEELASSAYGDNASTYLPHGLRRIPACPPGFHKPVGD